MDTPWVEKYRPKSLRDIVGNYQAIAELKNWAMTWSSGKKEKPLILVGKPGCGKSSAARALANDMGWGVIELNASDVRNEASIKRIAMVGAVNETFSDTGEFLSSRKGGRKLIILDEADNLYEGKDDRGGKKAIVETIKVAKQPMILIGNDYYGILKGTWGSKLRSLCKVVKFKSLLPSQMVKVMERICKIEGIVCEKEALRQIAKAAEGDMRAAINDLQAVAMGKKVLKAEDVNRFGWRDKRNEIYSTTMKILRTDTYSHALEATRNLDETPDFLALWVEENLPMEYRKLDELAKAYDYLSKADMYLGRVMRRQHYALWSYAIDMIAAVSIAKKQKYGTHPRYLNFPSWLKNMSKSKDTRMLRDSVSAKVGCIYHASPKVTKERIIPYFRVIYDLDPDLRALYTYILRFTPDEIAFLTEKNPREILEASQKIQKEIEKG